MLITEIGDIKLGYLGLVSDLNSMVDMDKVEGSYNYLSPELINFEAYNDKIDVW